MAKIVQAPNSVLSEKAKPVEKIDKHIKKVLKEMREGLASATDPEGVGLAAPQIGRSLQIFITKPHPDSEIQTFINPVIEELINHPKTKNLSAAKATSGGRKTKKPVQLEGCLSLKDIWGTVKRYNKVVLLYMNEKGEKHKETFTGFMSVIVQHEVDHLQGVLFPKRVLEQKSNLYKSYKNEKGETEFEELEI